MVQCLPIWCLALVLGQEPVVQTQFVQVAPPLPAGQPLTRSSSHPRAVVLIHGFSFWPLTKGETRAELHAYQRPNSPLVKRLSLAADVFALAYEQTIPITEFAGLSVFRQDIQLIRELGYTEIVLVGFSAGGLIARQFVEDAPAGGVTKVIQVDSPNLGTA
ncbi:hypothetical protein AYO44_11200 [Planctomycetaceae bacterium SCGC AG-212-F19]|nr:hypothetical protein AYO44_11200 [Planctomycetaceae bacterium SCGC AG-212-F19]